MYVYITMLHTLHFTLYILDVHTKLSGGSDNEYFPV